MHKTLQDLVYLLQLVVYPASGPVNGGTLLTISGNHLGNANDSVYVDISGEPKIIEFSPTKGILSGNTTITIMGLDIGFEGQNRYNISFCDDVFCIECSESEKVSSSNYSYIKCKTGKSIEPRHMTQLNVVIDDLTALTLNATFQYLPDPTFNISTEFPKSLQSGGALFTIHGDGFNNVGEITVERVDKPCDVPEDTSTECETPPRLQNQPNNQTIEVNFDGVTIQVTLEYVNDPTFERFQGIVEYDMESSIRIKGRNILNVARYHDYHINIGLDGTCLISYISMELITCIPPKSVPRTNKTDVTTVHVIVIVGLLGAGLVGSVIMGMSAVSILRRKKTKAANKFKMEIKAKEEIIQEARRDGVSERRRNVRVEDGDEYAEPDGSIYDEINADEENNTRENSYLDVYDGYDELGQRSPTHPYNQLQITRDENQRPIMMNSEIHTDDKLHSNRLRNEYLSLSSGYEKPISRNDPHNQIDQESAVKKNEMTNLDNHLRDSSPSD
ncbi:PLXNA [Mytilus coruscus]|uniref:PLXNA n=1 Tax=Mytilus coruscus TaxID=42192 RepID=A0A6J8A2P7_MYTCO|nr:PLXNA [Mytilus coruscus]